MTTKSELRRWATPVFGLVIGVVLAVIFLAQGEPGAAAACFAIMAGYSAVLVLGRRNEAVGLLGSGETDERREAISSRSALTSGYVLLAVVLGALVWEIAHGRDGQPYVQLGAVAGLSFLVGTFWYRRTM